MTGDECLSYNCRCVTLVHYTFVLCDDVTSIHIIMIIIILIIVIMLHLVS